MQSFSELLVLWPSLAEVARELTVPYDTVISWKRRKSVPYEYWPALVASAARFEIRGITMERLADAAEALRLHRRKLRPAPKVRKPRKPRKRPVQRDRQGSHAFSV
jgi:hypothetical protein